MTASDNQDDDGKGDDGEGDWEIANSAVWAAGDWSPDSTRGNALVMKVNGRYANKPHIVDSGVTVASTPADGNSCGTGETIAVDAEFNTRALVNTRHGAPELVMRMGDATNPVREQLINDNRECASLRRGPVLSTRNEPRGAIGHRQPAGIQYDFPKPESTDECEPWWSDCR